MHKTIPDKNQQSGSSAQLSTTFCVACHMSIHALANKCRYCGSEQKPNPWNLIAQLLKWLGGITAFISLILGILRVNDIFSDWKERNITVTQLVSAAKLQLDSNDYQGAWQLVDDALKFNPASQLALQQRINIALSWLRNMRKKGDKTFSDFVEKLLPTLYLGAVSKNPDIVANSLAHIGWANFLRSRDGIQDLEIKEYYKRALKLDPENTYAHIMLAHYKLWQLNSESNSKTNFTTIKSHIEKSFNSTQNHGYVRGMQISALLNASSHPNVQIELIKVAEEIRQKKETLEKSNRHRFFGLINDMISPPDLSEEVNQETLNQLIHDVPPRVLLELFNWLNTDNDNKNTRTIMTYARLEELNGNNNEALLIYQKLADKTSMVRHSHREFAKLAIKRLTLMNKGQMNKADE